MKKVIFYASAIVAVLSFSACNKDKFDELQEQIDTLETENNNLQSQINDNGTIESAISISSTGNRKLDSAAFTISAEYTILEEFDDKTVEQTSDSTYDISIELYNSEVEGYAYIFIEDYTISSNIEDLSVQCGINGFFKLDGYDQTLDYYQGGYLNNYSNDNIVFNSFSFNTETMDLSFNLTMTEEEGDDNNSTENPSTTTMSYSGNFSNSIVSEKKSK